MGDLPKESQRIVISSDHDMAAQLGERYARRALTVGAPPAESRPPAPVGPVRTVGVAWERRASAPRGSPRGARPCVAHGMDRRPEPPCRHRVGAAGRRLRHPRGHARRAARRVIVAFDPPDVGAAPAAASPRARSCCWCRPARRSGPPASPTRAGRSGCPGLADAAETAAARRAARRSPGPIEAGGTRRRAARARAPARALRSVGGRSRALRPLDGGTVRERRPQPPRSRAGGAAASVERREGLGRRGTKRRRHARTTWSRC